MSKEWFIKEGGQVCFKSDNTELNGWDTQSLVDCLNGKEITIANLEAKLAESEERINWLVEAEFNRKWAKKYIEMRRKEDPMLCLPDSDEVYEKYFELKQQLAEKDKAIENLRIDLKDWEDLEEKISTKYDKVVEQLAEKEKEIEEWVAVRDDKNKVINKQTEKINELKTHLKQANQDKISFAVEQLEKVKETFTWGKDNGYLTPKNAVNIIDNQIKQLKEGK